MLAEPGLSDARIDALFAEARAAEIAGRFEAALASLAIAVAELHQRGKLYQYPFEWLARLQCELGDLAQAERSLLAAREIAAEAGHRAGVFRMDVQRARVACASQQLEHAAALISELRGGGEAIGPPDPQRAAAIAASIDALVFVDRGRDASVLRAEAALAIAELWAEQGKYRSALWLVERFERPIAAAGAVIRSEQVELLRIEWLIAAGELADAERRLEHRAGEGIDAIGLAVVRARAALLGGRLAQAIAQLDTLARAPVTAPRLYACACAVRIAILIELNLCVAAVETSAAAIATLGAARGAHPLIAMLDTARRVAEARRRSALALWELPVVALGSVPPAGAGAQVAFDAVAAGASCLAASWTTAANAVLFALERGDLTAAIAAHDALARITHGVESSYIAARVQFSAAVIDYHRAPSEATLSALLEVGARMHEIGARQDEAQAFRFAAWSAARLGRAADHAACARHASGVIDEIAGELDAGSRALYLLNKWSGRDEVVSGRMRQLLADRRGRPRKPRTREVLRAFHEIERLTHWPIDDAFGDTAATRLAGDATADVVVEWLTEQLSSRAARATQRGFALRSTLGLWWFPDATLVLHYHVLPDRTLLFRIARRHLDVKLLPVGRIQLQGDLRGAVDDRDRLRELADQLGIAEALRQLPGIRRLVIIPHGAVAGVPFAALRVGELALCERVVVSQIDRLSRLRRPRRRHRAPARLVSVGLTSYAGSGHPDLPQTEAEARAVATALGAEASPQLYLGDQATCARVSSAMPTATHLHIASHGLFDLERPARSGVVLRDAAGHGALTLHQLRRLDLRGMELATLATCRSAQSAQLPGRERICLPSALLDAGARGVIASLWPVEDEPSLELMTALYRRLRTEPPATALARMQAERCGLGGSARSWAGLVFYGNE
jgi:hypothetical protein